MAQPPGVPWNQRPDYLALTQRVDPAGVVRDYIPPRPGLSATDVTSFVYGQATITIHNWPEVMYYLHPPVTWTAFRSRPPPPQKIDANGQPMFERCPAQGQLARPLLDFRILPDTICSEEELWWIDLWRRMDPRIHWADILMRIDIQNRTLESDRRLGNSTNNGLNRQGHTHYSMISWHNTGAHGTKRNMSRGLVLQRIAAARPPLSPNSTRGLTPGLIDPVLGYIPGNSIPQPAWYPDPEKGMIRLPDREQRRAASIQARANAMQTNQAQGNLPQTDQSQATRTSNNQGLDNDPPDNDPPGSMVPQKRRRTRQGHKVRPPKRHRRDPNDNPGNDKVDTESSGRESSEAHSQETLIQETLPRREARSTSAMVKVKYCRIKKKTTPKRVGRAIKARPSAEPPLPDNTMESEPNDGDNEEESEDSRPAAGQFLYEGDPGFEEAFQARRRPQSLNMAPPPRRPLPHDPLTSLTQQNTHQDTVSNSELLDEIEDSTSALLMPPPRRPLRHDSLSSLTQQNTHQNPVSNSELLDETEDSTSASRTPLSDAVNPQFSPPPLFPSNPAPSRQRINAMTGFPIVDRHHRPGVLRGYSDGPFRRRSSPARDPQVAQSAGASNTEDSARATNTSYAARLGFPVAEPNRPPRSYYGLAPDGSHYQFTDNSGRPTSITHRGPHPPSTTRIGFTPNQLIPVPPRPAVSTQPAPARAPAPANSSSQHPPPPTPHPSQLTGELARHNNALVQEMHRREDWPRRELGRHSRAVMELMHSQNTAFTWAAGYLTRQMERERRNRLGEEEEEDEDGDGGID